MRAWWVLPAALALAGCRFEDRVPAARIRCASAQDCPTDYACEPLVQRCVTRRAGAFSNLVVTPTRLGRGSRLRVSFELSPPPSEPPELELVTATSRSALSGELREGTFIYQRTLDALDGEGPGLVLANVRTSEREALGAVRLGEVFIDATGPRLTAARAELVPDEDHPLRQLGLVSQVSSLSEHSAWVVNLSVDEPLRAPPRLELWADQASAPSVVSTPTKSEGLDFTFELRTMPMGAQGLHRLRAHLEDVLGNPSDVAVEDLSIDVDTAAPAPPAVNTAGALVFRREPWGSQASPGAPRFTLRGAAGALEPDAVVQFFADGQPVGRARCDVSGGFEETALPFTKDRSDLEVRALDAAGNASALVAVRDLEWVATPAAPPGAPAPVRIARRGDTEPCRLLSTDEPTQGGELPEGARAEAPTGWRARSVPRFVELPAARANWRLYFDSGAQRTVLLTPDGRFVRERGGWRAQPGGSPTSAAGVLNFAAHDPINNQSYALITQLVFNSQGGLLRSRRNASLPESVCTQPVGFFGTPSGGPPEIRASGVAAAMDVRRGALLMFGGAQQTLGGWANSTWETTPVAGSGLFVTPTREVSAQGARPSARAWAALGYDRAAGRMLLFGGSSEDGGVLGDTWAYTPTDGWAEVTPPGAGPSPRLEAAMAWDGQREQLVLAGGRAGSRFTTDTWTWNGARWAPLGPGLARAGLSLSWDDARAELLLAGGYDSADGGTTVKRWPNDVLVLQPNGSFSAEAPEDAGPPTDSSLPFLGPGVTGFSLSECFDPQAARGFTYLSQVSGSSCDETDCYAFLERRSSLYTRAPGLPVLEGVGPGSRDRAALAVRPAGELMLVGGETAGGLTPEAWERLADGGWGAAPAFPSPLAAALLTPDLARGALVLHGGETDAGALRDTWAFDGQRWSLLSSTGPSLQGGESLSYLPAEGAVVLAQGDRLLALRNGSWQTTATLPLPASGKRSLGYDLSAGASLLLADAPDGGFRPLLFASRDAGWQRLPLLVDFFEAAAGGALGDNPPGKGVVLMRGLQSPLELTASGLRPELIATVDLSLLPRSPGDAVTSVRALALAGGSSPGRSGASLTPWFETGFYPPLAAPSAQTSAPPEALQQLLWRTSDPSLASRVSNRSALLFRVQALGESDREPARVVLDYFELTLGLRRPAAR